jgi:hypothetical protein
MAIDLSGYVDVAERVREFYAKYPDGSLQSEITTLTDSLVVVKAWAYRTPSDDRPAIGHSSLGIPGSTPYTKGSEIENAETSAWGRALAGLGFATKHIASKEEVQNKQPAPKAERYCSKHPEAVLQFSSRSKKWGHLVDGGEPCVEAA